MNDSTPQPIGLTVHTLEPPDLADPAAAARRRTLAGRLRMLLVLAVCAAPVVASYLAYYVIQPSGRTNYGDLIDPPRAMPAAPALTLATLQGQAQAASALQGQWLLVVVGDAACDSACERRLLMQRQLREMLGRDRERLDKVWLITDAAPLRDELRRALETAPATTVLRAPRAELQRWLEPAAGHTLEQHLFLVDPLGRWIMRMPANPEPARVKRDLERLMRASASWDRPGR